jgi:ABC-type transport system substrate-binding protein
MKRKTHSKLSKLLAFSLVVCVALSLLAGCGSTPSSETPASGSSNTSSAAASSSSPEASPDGGKVKEVVIGLEKDGGTLAPWAFVSFGNIDIHSNIYETLCKINADGSFTPCLMESVEEIDKVTYKIKLFENIYDTAGNHITASDAVFSIKGYVEAGNSGGVPHLDKVTVIDEYTFEWKNKSPFGVGNMYKEFANPRIVSEASYKASPDKMATTPVGTTPYKVTNYVAGSSFTLENTGKYWQADKSKTAFCGIANIDKIVFNIILDSSQMAMALQSGNIDFAGQLNNADLASFKGNDKFNIIEKPSVKPYLLVLNASADSPCKDINLRLAILNAINNDDIVAANTVKSNALTSISNPTQVDYQAEWKDRKVFAYNPDLAKEYLAKSSYKGEELRILLMGGAISEACAMVIQAELAEIGVKVVLDTVDNANYRTRSSKSTEYDLLINENGGGPYCSQCWNNAFSYTNKKTPINDPALQEKLDKSMNTGTKEDLMAFQNYVDEMAYAKGLIIPIFETASTKKINSLFFGTDNQFIIGASTFN